MPKKEWPQFGFLGLLICLVFLLVVSPFLKTYSPAHPVLTVFTTAVLLFSVYSFLDNKRVLVIAALLATPAFIFNWVSYSFHTPTTLLIKYIFITVFFAYIVFSILSEIFRKNAVTLDLIYGSVCVYLLIGVGWAYVYAGMELIFPGSFNLPLEYIQAHPSNNISEAHVSLFLYYSYVTLTTLGYGDITPASPPAQSMATLEAITGQFYIAILVARLVGIYSSKHKPPQ
jgi:voltage-gated potassium channel